MLLSISPLRAFYVVSYALTMLAPLKAIALASNDKIAYKKGDLIPVTCLNRTIETGEHVTDSHGNLQYIPFPSCDETSAPLTLPYKSSAPQNCTITLTDPLFHLLEYYIHNDAPLTCRIPTFHPSSPANLVRTDLSQTPDPDAAGSVIGRDDHARFVPLVIALAGTLQRSHLHVGHVLNVVMHVRPARDDEVVGGRKGGAIEAAAAYSVGHESRNTRIVIGDSLKLELRVTWYDGTELPAGRRSAGSGGGMFVWLFGVGVGAAVTYVLIRGDGLRRYKSAAMENMGIGPKDVLPKYNGYGLPGGAESNSGWTFGKKD